MPQDIVVSHYIDIKTPSNNWKLYCLDQNSYNETLNILNGKTYNIPDIMKVVGGGNKIIFDIGANVGAFSLLCSRVWPEGSIFAFEPSNNLYRLTSHNIYYSGNVAAFNYGLENGNHRIPLLCSKFGSVGGSIGSSMHTIPHDPELIDIKDARQTIENLGISSIDILKIDTEGCEVPIIKSLGIITHSAATIVLEYHSDEDRLWIDQTISKSHILHSGSAVHPHRGSMFYIRRDLIDPYWDSVRISLPDEFK